MERQNPVAAGFAAAVTVAILYSLCALAFALLPDATLAFFSAWFHGLDLSLLAPAAGKGITVGAFLAGLAGVAVTGFAAGALFAFFYNLIGRR